MTNQFSRTETLIGKDSLNKLKTSHIAVFGAGGVGGYVIEALVRAGVGSIDIIDNDTINITNLNRQIIALHSTIGQYKVDAFQNRILDINPECNVKTYKTFFTSENSNEFDFRKYDYVVDAIDTVSAKIELVLRCQEVETPIISSMGTGNKLNPEMFEVSDIYKTSYCPLAKVMRGELKKRGVKRLKVVYSKEIPKKINGQRVPASISFVPPAAGLIIASEVVKDIII